MSVSTDLLGQNPSKPPLTCLNWKHNVRLNDEVKTKYFIEKKQKQNKQLKKLLEDILNL